MTGSTDTPIPQLADIHLPDPVASFPWAPGWWLLLALGAILTAVIAWWLQRRARHNRYRRQAATELSKLDPALSDQQFASLLNQLLRRAALQASGADAAALTGEAWYQYLCRQGGKTRPIDRATFDTWQAVAYGAETKLDRDTLRDFATQWLRYHQPSNDAKRRPLRVKRRADDAGV